MIGVIINKEGADLKIKVNGGVVLACGGFEHNQEMISSYLQMPYVHQQGGLYNDGDGIKMALGAGAICGICPTPPVSPGPISGLTWTR